MRNFNRRATFATAVDIQELFNNNAIATIPAIYDNIRFGLESAPGMHNTVHCAVGGTMCAAISAEAPEFYLLHSNIDRLWDIWQNMHPNNKNAYSMPRWSNLPGTSNRVSEVLDNNNILGVRIEYVNSERWVWHNEVVRRMTRNELLVTPRIFINPSDEEWLRLRGDNEIELIKQLELTRNNTNVYNLITKEYALMTNQITVKTGCMIKPEYTQTFDSTGCLENNNPTDINNRCQSDYQKGRN
jgi:hypothetical protein